MLIISLLLNDLFALIFLYFDCKHYCLFSDILIIILFDWLKEIWIPGRFKNPAGWGPWWTGLSHLLASYRGPPHGSGGITPNPQVMSACGTERKTGLQNYRFCDEYFKIIDWLYKWVDFKSRQKKNQRPQPRRHSKRRRRVSSQLSAHQNISKI